MDKFKVLRTFSSQKYSDSELSVKVSFIIEKMTGSTRFSDPVPSLETIQTALANYNAARDKCVDGTRQDTVVKNQLRSVLEGLLKDLATYVQQVSAGDEAMILSSGFDASKRPSYIGSLECPTNFKIKMGKNKGSVVLSCDVVENARFYEFEYTETPSTTAGVWTKIVNTKHKVLIEGLSSGKQYVFRVAGAGSDPSRNWSDEISSFVL